MLDSPRAELKSSLFDVKPSNGTLPLAREWVNPCRVELGNT